MTLKKNILNVFLVIMMVLCLTSCKSSKLMIEEININQLEKLIENKDYTEVETMPKLSLKYRRYRGFHLNISA